MVNEYLLSGVQLGMLYYYAKEGDTDGVKKILEVVEHQQWIGRNHGSVSEKQLVKELAHKSKERFVIE